MNDVTDVSALKLEKSRILFDTNVWMLIYGLGANVAQPKMKAYSAAYSNLLKSTNKIVVNDYVLGEFCNRCVRYEYDVRQRQDRTLPRFKEYRSSAHFRDVMESIRDTCLHILDDSEYVRVGNTDCDARKAVQDFCNGELDFSDLILVEYCLLEKLYLMTDDADFVGCGVNLITHNAKLLKSSKV